MMELTDLKGNALKVYLKLLEGRDDQGVCRVSKRELSRQLDLYRDTVGHTLGQLERFGLIEGRDPGWSVSPQLLADYLQRSGWKNQPRVSESGGKNQPRAWDDGWKNQPPLPEGGGKKQPPAPESGWKNQPLPSSDQGHGWKNQPRPTQGGGKKQPPAPAPADPPTRTRTLWSSSSEEDSSCTAVPPSSSSSPSLLPSSGEGRGEEGGLGGENPRDEKTRGETPPRGEGKNTPGEKTETTGEGKKRKIPPSLYLSQMQSWWDAIWPDNLDEEIPWFGELWEAFGEEIPVQALRQFAESGRTLADLDYPDRFPNYFRTCCRNAQQGSPSPPEKPASPATQRSPSPEGNGRFRPSSEGNGQHPTPAEQAPASASKTNGEQVLADVHAEEIRLKEGLVNHMATFWANQAKAPHTRSPDHFLASFRRERRRP